MSDNLSSSFDSLLSADTSGEGSNSSTQKSTDSTNQEGQNALLSNLITTLNQKGSGPEGSDSSESTKAVDFSELFADGDAPAKPAPQPVAGGEPDAAPSEEEVTILTQLSDDKVMGALVNGISAGNAALPTELAALFGEGDNSVDSIEMTREGMTAVMNHAVAAASRQSLNQTINLLRQVVPALSKQTETAAANKFNVTKQMDIAMSELGGNEQLIALATKLSAGKTIKNGKEFAQKIKSLMHTINNSEMTTIDKAKPAAAPTSKQFLQLL